MMQLQKEEDGTKVVNGFYEMTSAMTQEEIDALLDYNDLTILKKQDEKKRLSNSKQTFYKSFFISYLLLF